MSSKQKGKNKAADSTSTKVPLELPLFGNTKLPPNYDPMRVTS
ncbi:unnamed protein product, partial [Brassica rapa subsp. trilocularis]